MRRLRKQRRVLGTGCSFGQGLCVRIPYCLIRRVFIGAIMKNADANLALLISFQKYEITLVNIRAFLFSFTHGTNVPKTNDETETVIFCDILNSKGIVAMELSHINKKLQYLYGKINE